MCYSKLDRSASFTLKVKDQICKTHYWAYPIGVRSIQTPHVGNSKTVLSICHNSKRVHSEKESQWPNGFHVNSILYYSIFSRNQSLTANTVASIIFKTIIAYTYPVISISPARTDMISNSIWKLIPKKKHYNKQRVQYIKGRQMRWFSLHTTNRIAGKCAIITNARIVLNYERSIVE